MRQDLQLLCRISLLLRVKASQTDKLKDMEKRVKILLQKKESFEESTQHDLQAQNVIKFIETQQN